jgi:hypothetical protein
MAPLFREQQQFRQKWLWLLFVCISTPIVALLGFGLYQQLVLDRPFGGRPMSDGHLVLMTAAVLVLHSVVIALFWFARLDVDVTPNEIEIRFRPFHLHPRRIHLQEVTDARARHYSALGEYGGWGIRIGLKGWAYNVSGDEGVQLTLASGKRILIGSQRSSELEEAIRRARATASS